MASSASSVDLAARLAAVKDRSTLRITTRGRQTGKPHTVTIWFLVDGTTVHLGTMNARRDWVRNARRNPDVELDIGGLRLRGRLATVAVPDGDAHSAAPFLRKYWLARIASWFGVRPDAVFRVDGLAPVAG